MGANLEVITRHLVKLEQFICFILRRKWSTLIYLNEIPSLNLYKISNLQKIAAFKFLVKYAKKVGFLKHHKSEIKETKNSLFSKFAQNFICFTSSSRIFIHLLSICKTLFHNFDIFYGTELIWKSTLRKKARLNLLKLIN